MKNACNIPNCMYCNNDGECLRCSSNHTIRNNQCAKQTCDLPNC